MMDDVDLLVSEAEMTDRQDRERRLRLARQISTLFLPVAVAFMVALPFSTAQLLGLMLTDPGSIIVYLLALAGTLLLFLSFIASRRNHLVIATIAIAWGAVITTFAILIAIALTQGISAILFVGFIPLGTIVVMAALLLDWRAIIGLTAGINLFDIILFFGLPHRPFHPVGNGVYIGDIPGIRPVVPFLVINIIILQWGLATVLIAGTRTYQKTLRDLGSAKVDLQRSRYVEQLKDAFIRSINHELRNPIMALLGIITLLKSPRALASEDRRNELFDRADIIGDRLLHLLESILSVRRMEDQTEVNLQPLNVSEQVSLALKLVDPREAQLDEREIRLLIPPTIKVMADAVYLQQILINLISNAAKYSSPATPVEISCGIEKQSNENKNATIHVRDWGLGIPPEQAPILFKRFVRLPRDLASHVTGNGLGLYLCREFATRMGGTISLFSTGIEGEGTRMTLALPLARESSDEEYQPQSGASSQPITQPRIYKIVNFSGHYKMDR